MSLVGEEPSDMPRPDLHCVQEANNEAVLFIANRGIHRNSVCGKCGFGSA
jgi:hypothetical protein